MFRKLAVSCFTQFSRLYIGWNDVDQMTVSLLKVIELGYVGRGAIQLLPRPDLHNGQVLAYRLGDDQTFLGPKDLINVPCDERHICESRRSLFVLLDH